VCVRERERESLGAVITKMVDDAIIESEKE